MTIEVGFNPDSGGRTMMLHSTESGRFLPATTGEVRELVRAVKDGGLDGLFSDPPVALTASAGAPARPPWDALQAEWFTEAELVAVQAAYAALTRVGNATAESMPDGRWAPLYDRGQQALGAMLAIMAADRIDAAGPR